LFITCRTAFKDLKSLHDLHLENNRLSNLQDNVFMGLYNLESIYLANNQLNMRSSRILKYCRRLKKAYLKRNNISQIFADWIYELQNLEFLDLKYNKVQHLKVRFKIGKIFLGYCNMERESIWCKACMFIFAF